MQVKNLLENGLTAKQELAIYYLVYEHMGKGKIAELLHFDPKNFPRWFRDPVFVKAHEEAVHARFAELAGQAMATVEASMNDVATPAAVRLNAAKDILSRAGYDAASRSEVKQTSEIIVELFEDENKGQ